jgi:hypothetical protein
MIGSDQSNNRLKLHQYFFLQLFITVHMYFKNCGDLVAAEEAKNPTGADYCFW